MVSWETYKRAGWEYSRLRPLLVFDAAWTPTPGVLFQDFPAGVIGVESINFGTYAGYGEIFTAGAANALWNDETGRLLINPVPEVGTTYAVVWRKAHLPVEVVSGNPPVTTGTFPTIPVQDLPYVDDLERAIILEAEAQDIEEGPIIYQVGQTVTNRATAANGLRAMARTIRLRVTQALETPIGASA